jgi:hypothetical protein
MPEYAQTASAAYGFQSWNPLVAGGTAIMPETQIGTTGDIPSASLPDLPFLHGNPLFWLLLLFLVWTGYVYGAFDVGVKKIGSAGVKVGGRS